MSYKIVCTTDRGAEYITPAISEDEALSLIAQIGLTEPTGDTADDLASMFGTILKEMDEGFWKQLDEPSGRHVVTSLTKVADFQIIIWD